MSSSYVFDFLKTSVLNLLDHAVSSRKQSVHRQRRGNLVQKC